MKSRPCRVCKANEWRPLTIHSSSAYSTFHFPNRKSGHYNGIELEICMGEGCGTVRAVNGIVYEPEPVGWTRGNPQ